MNKTSNGIMIAKICHPARASILPRCRSAWCWMSWESEQEVVREWEEICWWEEWGYRRGPAARI